jgi:hypothetical protein
VVCSFQAVYTVIDPSQVWSKWKTYVTLSGSVLVYALIWLWTGHSANWCFAYCSKTSGAHVSTATNSGGHF